MAQKEDFRALLLRLLAGGEGLDALVGAAGAYLGQPVTVCDAAYTLLATWPTPQKDDGVFAAQASRRMAMRPEVVEELQKKGITARLRREAGAFSLYNESLGQWEVFCAVRLRRQVAGYLFLRAQQPADQAALDRWTALAEAVAAELQKLDPFGAAPLQPAQAGVLRQIVEGQLTDPALMETRLRQTGWQPRGDCRVCCLVSLDAPLFAALGSEQLLRQLTDLIPGSICYASRESIVVLCPAWPAPAQQTILLKLRHWLGYYGFYLAASMPFSALARAPHAYIQAQSIVQMLLRGRDCFAAPANPIFCFEAYLPLCTFLLSHPPQEVEPCLHPHIRQLLAHDRAHGTAYIPTLTAYFDCGRSMTAASAALYIHKTTLFYRMGQMEKLVGPFLKDPARLFLYEYSLRLLRQLTPAKTGPAAPDPDAAPADSPA